MQINSQLSTYTSINSLDSKQQASRLPVVYTGEESAEFVVEQAAETTQITTPSAPVDEAQEARFIRAFASVERELSSDDESPSALPKAVQEYQAVSTLSTEQISGNVGNIVDETV